MTTEVQIPKIVSFARAEFEQSDPAEKWETTLRHYQHLDVVTVEAEPDNLGGYLSVHMPGIGDVHIWLSRSQRSELVRQLVAQE